MVHFFVFQGCLYFVPWDTLVLGHFVDTVSSMCTSVIYVYQCHTCVIHVYQCHTCVPVSYMCTSVIHVYQCYMNVYLVLSRGVRGPCTKFLVLFYI
jgi:hypothetical protein